MYRHALNCANRRRRPLRSRIPSNSRRICSFPFVFNESHHIGQWIAEKQADLMGAALPGGFLRQPAQRLLGI